MVYVPIRVCRWCNEELPIGKAAGQHVTMCNKNPERAQTILKQKGPPRELKCIQCGKIDETRRQMSPMRRKGIIYCSRQCIRLANFVKLGVLGLEGKSFQQLLDAQQGVCAICKNVDPIGRELSVDHDHKTMIFRGLLCITCNQVLGLFKDDPERFKISAAYLLRPAETKDVPCSDIQVSLPID